MIMPVSYTHLDVYKRQADIVERRMLPKGNVSAGVETLVQKGLLMRRQDQTDRRKIHLSLLRCV